jgi:uncharacterized membrane protein
MNASPAPAMQMQMAWHNGGLFMGMHWIWWTFWLVMLAVLFLAFWRLLADSAQTRSNLFEEERAEEALRHRFATGEIDEEEYVRRLEVLRETMLGR